MSSSPSTHARRRPRRPRRSARSGAAVLAMGFAVAGCSSDEPPGAGQAATQRDQPPPRQQQPPGGGGQAEGRPQPGTATGRIVGRATDAQSGRPLSNVYIVVGYQGIQRAAITGPDGRYVVPEVPANEPAAILGFHENNYRYHNSQFDRSVVPRLRPGQTIDYDFQVRRLPPRGQPEVTDAAIATTTARPGQTVEFALTVTKPGEGGLSQEVFAASPKMGRVAWLRPAGGNRFRGTVTVPPDTPPGEYPFAFFAASNQCYDPEQFPRRTLRVLPG